MLPLTRTFEASTGRKIWVQQIVDNINSQYLVELMAEGYVIAFWAPHPEGAQLKPVGNRITEEIVEPEIMMAALRAGQEMADLLLTVDRPTVHKEKI